MNNLQSRSNGELMTLRSELMARCDEYRQMRLNLNMMRGNPSPDQLALSEGLFSAVGPGDYKALDGMDCRNYGCLDGLPEMKSIFADILDINPAEVIVGGNSSLSLMYENVASNMTHGVWDGRPWQGQGEVKFICPTPGYDRHFAICKYFHITMLPVDVTPDGKELDYIEEMVSRDPMIKGVWCVPIFQNPTGIVFTEETVRRYARLRPAASDFRLYWDNAYVIHHFRGDRQRIPNIIRECEEAGNAHMPLVFASFSKISFAGSAVACMAASTQNCDYIRKRLAVQTIGPNKLNQLAHARFFGDAQGVYRHMERYSEIVAPKFAAVQKVLRDELEGLDIASWSDPDGGYFISFQTMPNCAKKVHALCADMGVHLTTAGATYPYGYDPHDANLRIAPTFPSIGELETAIRVFGTAVKLCAVEKLLDAAQ